MHSTRFRPRFEIFEDRLLLSTVTNLADDGPGSFRNALAITPAGGTIDFAPNVTGMLTLTSGPLLIANNVTVNGPGPSTLSINGDHRFQLFRIDASATVSINGLGIVNGLSNGPGGAIANEGNLTLTNCTVSGSRAATGNGGGIFNDHNALTLINCTVSNNVDSAGNGGGIYNTDGTLTLLDSTIAGNTLGSPANGAGLYLNAGTATLTNVTVANNQATGSGGGIFVNAGSLTASCSTIADNSAAPGTGGGLDIHGGTVSLRNSIVAGNTATGGIDVDGTVTGAGSDLIGDGTGSTGLINGLNGNQVGTTAAPLNPHLGMLQNNGGPTPTMALLPGSPAIGAGSNVNAPAGDQRGYQRIINGTIDVGAYEYQPPATSISLSPLATANVGQAVTLSATVIATTPGSNIPQGTVTFLDGGRILGKAPLTNGQASLTLSTLTGGSHRITVRYSGLIQGDYQLVPAASAPVMEFIRGGIFAISSASGRVQVRRTSDGAVLADFAPYGAGYTGGVSVAVGDINGDGYLDVVTGQLSGGAEVKVYDGKALVTGTFDSTNPDASLITHFLAYDPSYHVGVNVAVGDINGNGFDDIVTGAIAGNPHVKVYSGLDIANKTFRPSEPETSLLTSFFAYGLQYNVGVNVAVGDINGDGFADIVTGATVGNPHVKVYDGAAMARDNVGFQSENHILSQFFAYGVQFNIGVNVAVGDVNGDGYGDIITGATAGNPHVKVFDGKSLMSGTAADGSIIDQFFAYGLQFNVGTTVAATDFDGNGMAEILTGASTGSPHFRVVHGNATGVAPPALFEDIPTDLQGGLRVSA
jgi:predicted outer membrane repeat protein